MPVSCLSVPVRIFFCFVPSHMCNIEISVLFIQSCHASLAIVIIFRSQRPSIHLVLLDEVFTRSLAHEQHQSGALKTASQQHTRLCAWRQFLNLKRKPHNRNRETIAIKVPMHAAAAGGSGNGMPHAQFKCDEKHRLIFHMWACIWML